MDNKPDGHEDAMRDLMRSAEHDQDEDFATWQQRFKAKDAAAQAKKEAQAAKSKEHFVATVKVEGPKPAPSQLKWDFGDAAPKKGPYEPIRMEIFCPPPELEEEAKKRGLKFTVGRKYPIYSEVPEHNNHAGMRYVTLDDEGNRRSVNAVHFSPEAHLVWTDVVDDSVLTAPAKKPGTWSVTKIAPDTFTLNI